VGVSDVEFDPARLDAHLRAHLPGLAGPMRLERVAGGQSNPTFFVTYDSRRLVLRKQPPGPLLPSAHAVDREHRIIAALRGSPVPVPAALLFCDDRSVVGTPFYVMERLQGRVFHDCALPGSTPDERRALYRSMAETLAALHAVEPAACGLADYGRPQGFYARQMRRWSDQWRAARTREDAQIERLIAWLPDHVPDDPRTGIVHGDYRIGNLMFAPEGAGVEALLDWELSTLGPPLSDLAHSCIAWHSTPDQYGGLLGLDLRALGIPSQVEYEADYYAALARRGVPVEPRLSAFHMAFALFRWSMIFEGIAARAKAGTASSADAGTIGGLAAHFAARAARLIDAA
jgi:aminoglycoside phosphotransferase (APT) family kinase protein